MRAIRRLRVLAAALVMLLLLPGCIRRPPTTVPIPALHYPGSDQRRLFVFLPGIRNEAGGFQRQGLVTALRDRDRAAAAIAVDAHFGYYEERSVLERLRDDVILPARRQGYGEIWLVGVSLGGLGALLYEQELPEDIDGVIVLSPFLGKGPLLRELADAGGAQAWAAEAPPSDDTFRELWRWLATAPDNPRVTLAYGLGDRFREAQELLAQVLPADRVFTTPGGHDWRTWRTLWGEILDSALLDRPSAAPSQR